MGFFKNLLKKITDNSDTQPTGLVTHYRSSTADENRYYKFFEKMPYIGDFYGRPFDMAAYNDSYATEEGYKLRELLLLVWWGKPKKGRKSSVAIPKYYFNTYNLNATQLTKSFFDKNFLTDDGERITLTEQGMVLFEKYKSLWEIHSFKGIPTNLDVDFPDWDLNEFTLKFYRLKLKFLKSEIKHYTSFIEFLNNSSYPLSAEERLRDIEMYQNFKNHDITESLDLTEKIEVLEDILKNK